MGIVNKYKFKDTQHTVRWTLNIGTNENVTTFTPFFSVKTILVFITLLKHEVVEPNYVSWTISYCQRSKLVDTCNDV